MPTNRRTTLFLAGLLLLALCGACQCNLGDSIQAQVSCEGTDTDIVCDVTHTGGSSGQVCWDVRFTCANGTISEGTGCAQLAVGGTAQTRIPVSSLSNYASCDQAVSTEILNLRQNR